ncbi:hypothetical protein CRE_13049 [Caenorhabditis remanei]|uniref:G-protein coupled receptors family 1 profile domain-containing protein n=1 Tax=Caenorhabditis remanei TaxID=31234 RepID=E3N7H4_CAERE|nr:hypothetical protein CRE_13049 [Caenorhabditis remanei]
MTDYDYQYQYEYKSSPTSSSSYPSYSYEVSKDYNYLEEQTVYDKIYSYSSDVNFLFQAIVILINLVHLLILIQKEIRSNTIYVLMIGICVSDLLNFSISIYLEGVDRGWYRRIFSFSNLDCLREDYEIFNVGYEVFRALQNSTRPISVWLAILMALFRTITILYPLKPFTAKISSFYFALCQILLHSFTWLAYYSWNFLFLSSLNYPQNLCDDEEKKIVNRNSTQYVFAISVHFYEITNTRESWEHWIRIVPTLSYPVLTALLLFKLSEIKEQRRHANERNNKKKEKFDNLTKLILFMTISFMLSEGIDGVRSFLIIDAFSWGSEFPNLRLVSILPFHPISSLSFRKTLLSSHYIITSLRCFNAMSHLFVCYAMSSQYRNTARRILYLEKKQSISMKVIPVISASSTSPRTSRK